MTFHPFCPNLRSFFFFFTFCLALSASFAAPLGSMEGDVVGMDTAGKDTEEVEGRPGSDSLNHLSSSCIRNPVRVLPRRRVGGVIRFVAVVLLDLSRLGFVFSYWVRC